MTRTTLVVVTGLPGAGKSTHARAVAEGLNAVRLAPDEWIEQLGLDLWDESLRDRIEKLQGEVARTALAGGASVVVEWGTWHREERERLLLLARSTSARAELHLLYAPLDVLHDRSGKRARESPAISRQDLEQWSRKFQTPTAGEASEWDRFLEINTG